MAGMTMCERVSTVAVAAKAGVATELVRGQEQELVERLGPLVRGESVSLDLGGVERIDAAGLAALITLYCDACKAGHRFTVVRPGRHVREILRVVGLDKLLLAGEEGGFGCMERSAA